MHARGHALRNISRCHPVAILGAWPLTMRKTVEDTKGRPLLAQ
jgi:hypothetical protein